MPAPNPSSTLFLPELPSDLNDSILERHFRGFTGFSSSRTRHDRNGKLVGFVEFDSVDDAVRCRDSMQGNSPFSGINWHIHFSNNTSGKTAPKRTREDEPMPRAPVQRTSYGEPNYPPRAGIMAPPGPPGYARDAAPLYPGHSPNAATPPPPQHFGQPQPYQAMPEMQPHQPNYMAMHLPPDASSTLYVEGLPPDATEREVSHIFRRFEGQGYQSIRMVGRESQKTPGRNLYLCFVEFDNAHQATIAMHQLQGYRLDKTSDVPGVKIVYAKSKSERRAAPPRAALPPPRPQERAPDERYESQPYDAPESYSDDRDHRRFGREHSDRYRDDYDDDERGDDDFLQRADEVSVSGLTDS